MKLSIALVLVFSGAMLACGGGANPARDLTKTGIPGAVVLVDGDVSAAGDVRADDRFRAGSVTKSFTAAIVLQLVAEGRLRLEQPIPEAGGAPLRTLLNHTSGVFNHTEDPRVFADGLLKRWTPAELVALSREHPPYFAAGEGYHYSNTNYVILGLVIERVTRRRFEDELQRRILHPLGLRDTRYDEGPRSDDLARGTGEGQDFTAQDTSWTGTAGAIVSTARDLARFYGALLGGRVLAPAQLAAMKTVDPVTEFYGLGLVTVRTSCGRLWGHDGMVPGYFTQAFASEDGRRQIVVLANLQPLADAQRAAVDRAIDEAHCS